MILCYAMLCQVASVVSDSVRPHRWQPTRLLCPWNSPGKNARVGNHSLLEEIFLTQGLNSGLLHYRQILYHLSHQFTKQKQVFNKQKRTILTEF